MRYASIRKMDISNGEGLGISLFVQGCHFHCKGCFNPETWDFNGGKEWTEEVKEKFIKLAGIEHIKRISILGGEPLCDENILEVIRLVSDLKRLYPEKKIWVYTGYNAEDFVNDPAKAAVVKSIDFIVDGRYDESKRDLSLKFRGSYNQRIIKVVRGEDDVFSQ